MGLGEGAQVGVAGRGGSGRWGWDTYVMEGGVQLGRAWTHGEGLGRGAQVGGAATHGEGLGRGAQVGGAGTHGEGLGSKGEEHR